MDRDTIRRGGAVGSAVGGGGTMTGDRGGEVPATRYGDDVAAGPRLIGLRSRAKRLERVRAGQLPGISAQEAPRVGDKRGGRGNFPPPRGAARKHDAARPEFQGPGYFFDASFEFPTP